ncbi:MAG: hypothetical protein GX216_01590 [Methanomicrobiales archaeon]|nr:hypothetical protein [Methanomicrobiales archaeon]
MSTRIYSPGTTSTMGDLNRIEQECRRFHDEVCSRGACGSAGGGEVDGGREGADPSSCWKD